jgi:hypothetical protein
VRRRLFLAAAAIAIVTFLVLIWQLRETRPRLVSSAASVTLPSPTANPDDETSRLARFAPRAPVPSPSATPSSSAAPLDSSDPDQRVRPLVPSVPKVPSRMMADVLEEARVRIRESGQRCADSISDAGIENMMMRYVLTIRDGTAVVSRVEKLESDLPPPVERCLLDVTSNVRFPADADPAERVITETVSLSDLVGSRPAGSPGR